MEAHRVKVHTGKYDMVEKVQYLYVRVVNARDLPSDNVTGVCDPYVEVRIGNYTGITTQVNPENWNPVFAFSKDKVRDQATVLEVTVKDNDLLKDGFMGWALLDLADVPKSVPEDSPLAPQWYRLEDRKGKMVKGEVMLAVWWGTQADEAFPDAWHPNNSASVGRVLDGLANVRSKVHLSPTLWYLRVNVIEAQDLVLPRDIYTKSPELVVNVTLGQQTLRTKVDTSRSMSPNWNEDLIFVAEEPFEEPLIVGVENRSANGYKNRVIGVCAIPLQNVDQRVHHKPIDSRRFNLENNIDVIGDGEKKVITISGRLHMRLCWEGGYHVVDESTHYLSDLRPTAKQLWKPSIGVLDLGILGASWLLPMKTNDGKATADAYCVAKYGRKWVRTRTIIDNLAPKWNEQYTWEVFDPCTVLTIGVFDNCHLEGGEVRDSIIGKVRIRLSTLETNCIYTHSYPLLTLDRSGVKKMGEIHLAVRFSCFSLPNVMQMYSQPLLPKMHYTHPLTVSQLDTLRTYATQIVSMRLSRADPPLRKEVVEYMLDVGPHKWSMRRSKANFFRVMGVLNGLISALNWFDEIRNWKNPIMTILIHILFVVFVLYPMFILPSVCLSLISFAIWNYRVRPNYPSHIDPSLSCADNAHPDELDEEFDTFPSSSPDGIVRMRYDRLRSVSVRVQMVLGELATQGERIQSLLSWRDPRATMVVIVFLVIAAIVLYAKPFYVVVIQMGFTVFSHPRFRRHNLPTVPLNFFRRLPSKSDYLL